MILNSDGNETLDIGLFTTARFLDRNFGERPPHEKAIAELHRALDQAHDRAIAQLTLALPGPPPTSGRDILDDQPVANLALNAAINAAWQVHNKADLEARRAAEASYRKTCKAVDGAPIVARIIGTGYPS